MVKISSPNEALILLKTNVLVSKNPGQDPLYYMLSTSGDVIVTNDTRKYYISIDEFKYSFFETDFYIYKSLKDLMDLDVEIDQEFRKLRQ